MNYKFVYLKDNKYYSYTKSIAMNYPYLQNWIVEYKLNEWTQPKIKNSLLFYFSTFKDAEKYINTFINISYNPHDPINHFALFECKVKKHLFISGWAVTLNMVNNLNYFWDNVLLNRNIIFNSKAEYFNRYKNSSKPLVFGMAKEIMLTKLIAKI
jgi:hypothetical protein